MITKFARLEFELFTRPSKSDFLRNRHFFGIIKKYITKQKNPVRPGNGHELAHFYVAINKGAFSDVISCELAHRNLLNSFNLIDNDSIGLSLKFDVS